MIDRLVRFILSLLLGLVLLSLGLRCLADLVLHAATGSTGRPAGSSGGPLSGMIVLMLWMIFVVGLGVRVVHALGARGHRGTRGGEVLERRTSRRPSPDVSPSLPDDALPADKPRKHDRGGREDA